jgi:hypothetical protein
MEKNTSGFYKVDGDLLYAPNFVLGAYSAYELRKETYQEHTYPIDGWYWFETENEARVFFNMPILEETNELNNLL